jgi:hypothetical protein
MEMLVLDQEPVAATEGGREAHGRVQSKAIRAAAGVDGATEALRDTMRGERYSRAKESCRRRADAELARLVVLRKLDGGVSSAALALTAARLAAIPAVSVKRGNSSCSLRPLLCWRPSSKVLP